jgi:Ca2+-binding RTX toxin-like protein
MSRKLTLEALDTRALPALGPVTPVGITLNEFGVLRLKGDGSDDEGRVWVADGQVHATLKHTTWVHQGNTEIPITLWEPEKVLAAGLVKSVSFYGADGNDTFTNDTGLPSTAFGQAGKDVLIGGWGQDRLLGGDDADTLEGRAGDDELTGGAGSDRYEFALVWGTLGTDTVKEAANADADRLDFAGLVGGITVNLGKTTAQAVKGNYLKLLLTDAAGVENVTGTAGNDVITGNARPNTVFGDDGNDTVDGLGGNDVLWGGAGADVLHGGTENDTLYGNDGPDKLYGDAGNDGITGGEGSDKLDGWTGNDKLSGEAGDDTGTGGLGDDQVFGGGGADVLDGGGNSDTVGGGPQNDQVLGGPGTDTVTGDDGDDTVDGGGGKDTMDGAAGTDRLFADQGNESLKNGEHVEITVPGGSPQNDSWSCGPNSAARLLRSYGINVTYATLKAQAQNSNLLSQYGLGTPPPNLRNVMKAHKGDTQLASGASFQSVLDRLGEGRPVIALLGWGEVDIPVPPEHPFDFDLFDTAPDTLHYVCLTGFDAPSQTVFYTDTDGTAKSMSYAAFQQKWNWPGDGIPLAALEAVGVKKRTMIW